jgi:kynurenine 3-monooxygenase
VIGCDGSASAIRAEMLKLNRFNFSQQYLDYGYRELTIPAGPQGEHVLETHALHIWPRGNHMLIALPNIDGTFACILFLPFEGEDSFAVLSTPEQVEQFFRSRFPDAVGLMPQLADNYFANPMGAMVTIKCSPWHVEGRALLLGDAAHAIVPFFGQGINCGFEDCSFLVELLDRHGADWPHVFAEFEEERKINTDAIADMAIENFVEMRDRVADSRFLLRKKVELALESRYPQLFVPKYAMVTFHRIPYSIALARGAVQDRMLAELCESMNRVEDLDWGKADRLIHRDLAPLELRQ